MLLLQDGTTIDGRYEVVGTIGSGGFGNVYKAFQKQFDRYVAVKLLNTNVLDEADGLPRFEREAKAIAGLQHKNIVAFYGYGVWQNSPYMVMELIEGTSLQSTVGKRGRLEPLTAARIMKQVCEALACAHANGVVHRDLKPSNIMLEPGVDGRELVKLIDFGLVKLMPGYGVANQKLTEAGIAVGTCHYMSPEQCIGGESDHRVDIYAAGCIFHQMLTGELPFDEEEAVQVMAAHLNKAPNPLSQRMGSSSLVDALQAIVNKAMAKDPEDRYQSATEMAADLDSITRGESGKLAQQGRTSQRMVLPKVQPGKKSSSKWVVPTIAILAALGAGAVVTYEMLKPKQEQNAGTAFDTTPLEIFVSFNPQGQPLELTADLMHARNQYDDKRYNSAERTLEKWMNRSISPLHKDILSLEMARILNAQGKPKQAEKILERAELDNPPDEQLRYDILEMLAQTRLLAHRFAGADEVYRKILLNGPKDRQKRAVLGLARVYVFQLKPEKAELRLKELDALLTPEQALSPPVLLLKITEAALQSDKPAADALVAKLEAGPYDFPRDGFNGEIWNDDVYRCQKELMRNHWLDLRNRVDIKTGRHWDDEILLSP